MALAPTEAERLAAGRTQVKAAGCSRSSRIANNFPGVRFLTPRCAFPRSRRLFFAVDAACDRLEKALNGPHSVLGPAVHPARLRLSREKTSPSRLDEPGAQRAQCHSAARGWPREHRERAAL